MHNRYAEPPAGRQCLPLCDSICLPVYLSVLIQFVVVTTLNEEAHDISLIWTAEVIQRGIMSHFPGVDSALRVILVKRRGCEKLILG